MFLTTEPSLKLLRIYLELQARSRESKLQIKPAPIDIIPPPRPHLLSFPQTMPQTWDQVFKGWRHFSYRGKCTQIPVLGRIFNYHTCANRDKVNSQQIIFSVLLHLYAQDTPFPNCDLEMDVYHRLGTST